MLKWFKGESKQLTHIQAIKNAEINLPIDLNLINMHRAITTCIQLGEIHFHFCGQELFALLTSSKRMNRAEPDRLRQPGNV